MNTINIGNAGTAYATTPNLIYTGAQIGDVIGFLGDAAGVTAQANVTSGATAGATITALELVSAATAHKAAISTFGGNTYISESDTGVSSTTHTSLIELIGVHTFSIVGGNLVVAS